METTKDGIITDVNSPDSHYETVASPAIDNGVTFKADEKKIVTSSDAAKEAALPMGKRPEAPKRNDTLLADHETLSHLWQAGESSAVDTNVIPGPAKAYDAHMDTPEKQKARKRADAVKVKQAKLDAASGIDYSKLDVSDNRYKQPDVNVED